MIPLFEYGGKSWTFLGMPLMQNRLAVMTWSYAFDQYQPRRIIEIGTNTGGFTILLGIQAWRRGYGIHTFDICKAPMEDLLPLSNMLPISFNNADCFSPKGEEMISDLIKMPGVSYVLCDGGDKKREFNHYAPFLKSGDVIAGHDYYIKEEYWPWGEITQDHVKESVDKYNLKPFMQEHFDKVAWLVYKKE